VQRFGALTVAAVKRSSRISASPGLAHKRLVLHRVHTYPNRARACISTNHRAYFEQDGLVGNVEPRHGLLKEHLGIIKSLCVPHRHPNLALTELVHHEINHPGNYLLHASCLIDDHIFPVLYVSNGFYVEQRPQERRKPSYPAALICILQGVQAEQNFGVLLEAALPAPESPKPRTLP